MDEVLRWRSFDTALLHQAQRKRAVELELVGKHGRAKHGVSLRSQTLGGFSTTCGIEQNNGIWSEDAVELFGLLQETVVIAARLLVADLHGDGMALFLQTHGDA